MSRGPEYRELSSTTNIIPDQRIGHERFSLKSERGDASTTAVLISMGVGFSILFSVALYPVISDHIFGKRVENYCIPTTILSPAQCYNNVTPPEGKK